jgi:hypothetical protein
MFKLSYSFKCPLGVYVIDTAELFAGLEGDSSRGQRSLQQTCRHLDLKPEYLHNAGNDAHVRCIILFFISHV